MSIGTIVSAGVLIAVLAGGRLAAASPQAQDLSAEPAPAGPRLLDVPFVPQSEALCGGAAVAMVLRYWGSPPIYAEDFAALVDNSAGGISLARLVRAVQDRGWRALAFAGTTANLDGHLADGRPIIALIEDRPGRNHYVVVVGRGTNRIVFHDPAGGRFRVMDDERFDRAWAVTGRAALLAQPQRDAIPPAVAPAEERDPPNPSASPRELAGVRFLQKRWADAARLSAEAVARDPADLDAWQLLAAARFLDGDRSGALAAWNRRDEPRVDLARIEGLDRTRHQVITDLLNLPPAALLTDDGLRRAARRVAALPSVQISRVSYSPRESGSASIDVAVVERPLVPHTWPSLVAAGITAAAAREARIDVASPSGQGERWTLSGRWWPGRPRVSVGVATPQLWRSSGLWRVEGSWERQTYGLVPRFESDRRRASITFADWWSGNLRWEVGGSLDHWRDRGKQMSIGAAVERRLFADRVAVRADGTVWPRVSRAAPFGTSAIAWAWRSTAGGAWPSWTGAAAVRSVTAGAPFDLWPAGDTGHVRASLLRAHPLLEDGAIRASGLGRVLIHGTLEYQRPLMTRAVAQLGWAAFVDVAKAARTPAATDLPMQVDFGAGLRARLPGAPGLLRIDVARGARDGHMAASVAWQTAWPGW